MRQLLISFLLITSILAFWAGKSVVVAKEKPEIPEVDGTYNDPDHPGLKVRVFVHKQASAKPTPPPPVEQCGLSDPESNLEVRAAGWKLDTNWEYNLNPSSVPSSVGTENLAQIALDGFNEWATPSGVNFTKGADTTVSRQAYDGLNIIAWGRTSGTALGVTYIRYYPGGPVVDVDTIMNKKFPWSWYDSNVCAWKETYDAENILTHELGHWVGLNDEYDPTYQDATMYGYGSKTEVKKTTLTNGDETGAASIYH